VIGGYTEPRGSRAGFGALLPGCYDAGELVYAGKAGTGFTRDVLRSLRDRLAGLERDSPASGRRRPASRGVHRAEPRLAAQIGFAGRTDDGER
jgi:bifunctional non-homologous end joining protein LigD